MESNIDKTVYAGILCINRTYGRTENGKRLLYKCIPDDRSLPAAILVPYQMTITFTKAHKNKYVLFRRTHASASDCHASASDCEPLTQGSGEIVETIGDVDSREAFNEYQVCRKRLNISLTPFTNIVKDTLKSTDEWPLIEKIMTLNPGDKIADLRNYHVITIDPDSCTDFDDAFSAQLMGNVIIINVYISHVFFWMESFGLWDAISDRVSTIYLPDRKRPMLPSMMSERLCSLQKGKPRVAFVMSIRYNLITGEQISEPTFMNALINVRKNYSYEDPLLNDNKAYCYISDIASRNAGYDMDSHEVVAWWMVKMNAECAQRLSTVNGGIFRVQSNTISAPTTVAKSNDFVRRWLKLDGPADPAQYSSVSSRHSGLGLDHYAHITSPIRRIADIVNQAAFMKRVMGYDVSDECSRFLDKWMGKIEYMNTATRAIRRIQMDCELLERCETDSATLNTIYSGMAIANECQGNESQGEYTIYIDALKLITYIKTTTALTLFEPTQFQIYIFNDESRLSRKIRIRHIA
jgi:exoribonuclease R